VIVVHIVFREFYHQVKSEVGLAPSTASSTTISSCLSNK
jgi:hypothetical protein